MVVEALVNLIDFGWIGLILLILLLLLLLLLLLFFTCILAQVNGLVALYLHDSRNIYQIGGRWRSDQIF